MSHSFIILSNNRPQFLEQCIEYFIQNNYPREKIAISDNSSERFKFKIFKLASKHQIKLFQNTTMSLGEHFAYALNLCDSDYVTFFHDDDLINLHYSEYKKNVDFYFKKKETISINFNGYHFETNKVAKFKNVLWKFSNQELKVSKEKLIKKYLDNDEGGVAPWCGYTYNLGLYKNKIIKIINNIDLKDPYFDTYLILQMLDYGEIYWINLKAYLIRLHEGSISFNTLNSYKSFINFVELNYPHIKKKTVRMYRYRNLLVFLAKKNKFKFLSIKLATYLFFNSISLRKLMLKKIFRLN